MESYEQNSVCELVRKAEQDYTSGTTKHSKYVDLDQYETINKIDAYLNSKHISGDTDSMGRDKPFFNIVTAARNIWYRATDIDRKQIKIIPTKSSDDIAAFLATVHLQNWMRKANFGAFLNDWGLSLASYGSSVAKFVEKSGDLKAIVVPWNRIICDTVDFDSNPVIEKLYFTPAQLKKHKGYDQEMVDKLLDAVQSRENLDGTNVDTKSDFIELYEVHGELPLSYLTGKDKDDDTYTQQMHVVSFVASKEAGKYDDFTLISGKEAKSPYMITHLIKEDGKTLSKGSVENLFDAQWMQNHTVKSIKDQLDLASKLIFQTSDGNFVGQNALNSIESGDILIHAINQPLTQISNNPDTVALQNFGQQWKALGNEINGISEAMQGLNQPSGSAWRQTEALLQESHSLFELMTENKGIQLTQMLREFVLPFVKKQMDTSEEVTATLAAHDLTKIDSKFIKAEAIKKANRQVIDASLKGELAQQPDLGAISKDIQGSLNEMGNQRFFKPSDVSDKTWKEIFKDIEWELEVDITGEGRDREAATTLNTVFQTIASNPMVLNDPNARMVFNKILEQAGSISPMEIATLPPPTPAALPPQGQPTPPINVPTINQ
jgi:hypothetical protein